MKASRLYGYISYGPIPKNEYTIDNSSINTDSADSLRFEPTPEAEAYRRRLKKRQSMHPSGRRKILGWSRTWKANGWRAEAAALQDEPTDMRRHSRYNRKNKPTF